MIAPQSEYMKELVYITDNPETLSELANIVGDVRVTMRKIDDAILGEITALAKSLASETWVINAKPSLAILTDIYFDSPASPYCPFPVRSEVDLRTFITAHAGRLGVMRIACAYTRDGSIFHSDVREVPGKVSFVLRGSAGTQLDRLWIPDGYSYTLSELIECQPHLNRRERAYRAVGSFLGTATLSEIYEAHITVEVTNGLSYQNFKDVCTALGIKAIQIELGAGKFPTHFITGSIHSGELAKVEVEVEAVAERLQEAGLRPTRRKIEARVQNRLVPLTDEEASGRSRSNYFEFHTKVTVRGDDESEELRGLCRTFGAHLARSGSNRLNDGRIQRFVTLRFHDQGLSTANLTFENLVGKLIEFGYQPTHMLKEYVVIDTNLDLDAGWADSAVPIDCYSTCDFLGTARCPFQDSQSSASDLLFKVGTVTKDGSTTRY
jgi:hypothetical protein